MITFLRPTLSRPIVYAVGGFILGGFTSCSVGLGMYLFSTPVRILERASGMAWPWETQLLWQRDEREAAFGQGFTLRVFQIPGYLGRGIVSHCPQGYTLKTFAETGMASLVPDEELTADADCCMMWES